MSDLSSPIPARADVWASTILLLVFGCSLAVLVQAGLAGNPALVLVSGGALAAALVVLASADWLDPLAALPFVLPLPALAGTGTLRVTPAILLTGVIVAAWLLRESRSRRLIPRGSIPVAPIATFLCAAFLSSIFARHHASAVREFTNIALLLGLLVAATAYAVERPLRVRSMVLTVSAVSAVSGLAAVLQMFGLLAGEFPFNDTGWNRATLGFGWPNELGTFFAVSIPVCGHACVAARRGLPRFLAATGMCVSVLGLIATFSRGSWIALMAGSLILLLAGEHRFLIRIWTVAVVLLLMSDAILGGAILGRIADTAADPLVGQRAALMMVALLVFRENPIIGIGPGGFAESLDSFGPQVGWLFNYVGTAHNAYLDIAAEMGLIGLISFLVFIASVGRILLRGARRATAETGIALEERSIRRALLWSFGTVCMVSFTVWPFAHGVGQLVMLIAALGIASEQSESLPSNARQ
ncbi:MAG: O-antigen ligase family protein [Gemmatimonadota bacterium]